MNHPEPKVNAYLNQLTQLILDTHSPADLIFLSEALSIDYEDLPADTPFGHTGELVIHLFQRRRLRELLAHLNRTHPSTTWPLIPEIVELVTLAPEERFQRATQLDHVPEPALAVPAGSRLPFKRNPFFTGRLTDLQSLAHTIFNEDNAAVIAQSASITGLGGNGKSQLAVEFAYRYGWYFAGGVFWLSFAEPANIPAEIATCGGPNGLNLPGHKALPFPDQVQRVQTLWQDSLPRLFIFDNCEDPDLLEQYRLLVSTCRVLLTSRNQNWQHHSMLRVKPHPLGVLNNNESKALLHHYLPTLEDKEATAIAVELGNLPLALHLAGSFLNTYQDAVTPATYLKQLQAATFAHVSLTGRGSQKSPTEHELHVARTFEISYRPLLANEKPEDAFALTLLYRAACLAPGELIPRDLLWHLVFSTKGVVSEDATHLTAEDTILELEDALRRLVGLGLLEPAENAAFRLHRLLAYFVTAQDTALEQTRQLVEKVVIEVAATLEKSGLPFLLRPWLPHLHHLVTEAEGRDEQVAYLSSALGYLLFSLGDYARARPYFERALVIHERVLGPDHPDTAAGFNNLGLLLQRQGDYVGARPYHQRALAIHERVLGPDHPDTARSLNNLGTLHHSRGDYVEAQLYYERALAIHEQALGPDHPDTALSLNNLGSLFNELGDYARAQPYHERALTIREKILGPNHPDTAQSLNNMGYLFDKLGRYAEAEPYYMRALVIRERAFGQDHPETINSLTNMGVLRSSLEDYDGAWQYHERALAASEKTLGPDHPGTALCLNNMGYLFIRRGDYEGAQLYYERALAIRERVLGPYHFDTALSLNNLGMLFHRQRDYVKAQLHYERALAIREQTPESNHPNTALILTNLGRLLEDQGDYTGALPYYERTVAIRKEVLGAEHRDTVESWNVLARLLNSLGALLYSQKDYVLARPCFERALAIFEHTLGPDHFNTQTVRRNLSALPPAP